MSEAAAILTVLERIAVALERQSLPQEVADTVDVEGAAQLLKTTQGAIYARHRRGKMPRRLPGRRLVWRTADLLRLGK
jgi:hypothetical protein